MSQVTPLPKDVYLMLTDYSSDRDIINMLSVNKKYNDPIFFRRIITKRYPALIKLKRAKESWKTFYLRMIYYLSLLKDKYDIDYINIPSFDPFSLYKKLLIGISRKFLLSEYIGETADKNKIESFLKGIRRGEDLYVFNILNGIAKSGNLKLFKEYEVYLPHFNNLLLIKNAILSQNPEMIEYVSDKVRALPNISITDIIEMQMAAASILNDIAQFKIYEEQIKSRVSPEDLKWIYVPLISDILESKNLFLFKYFIDNKLLNLSTISDYFLQFLVIAHTDKDIELIKYFFKHLEPEAKQKFLKRIGEKLVDKYILPYLR